jgi:SAM-dependent methyltransferase
MGFFRHSPSRIPALIWKNLKYPFSGPALEARFDRRHGIETIATAEESAGAKVVHLAIPLRHGAALISSVAAKAKGFAFIDIGCSKGRALALARARNFSRLIGIEMDPYFAAIARRNMKIIGSGEIVEMDALTYEFPPVETVFFLYRPFELSVAERMGDHIMESLRKHPRKIFILYYADDFPKSLAPLSHREVKMPYDPSERFKSFGFTARLYESA